MNDPEVVRGAAAYVRCIIRRPHAYEFLERTFADEGGIASATPVGCKTSTGRLLPLPGFYLLDADGRCTGFSPLRSKQDVLEFLRTGALEGLGKDGDAKDRASIRVAGFIEAEGIT